MKRKLFYLPLFLLQLACALFLLYDISTSVFGINATPIDWRVFELFEIGATVALIFGVVISGSALRVSLRRQAAVEETLRIASGDFARVIEERFDDWSLTPAERDVALFSLKGFSTSEIAAFRNTSEGTVKAQTNAIYRKAGVSGRSQLLSTFIEDLLEGPVRSQSSETL